MGGDVQAKAGVANVQVQAETGLELSFEQRFCELGRILQIRHHLIDPVLACYMAGDQFAQFRMLMGRGALEAGRHAWRAVAQRLTPL
ncbi:hypothetical protein D3C87_1284870 [compost metagenome]